MRNFRNIVNYVASKTPGKNRIPISGTPAVEKGTDPKKKKCTLVSENGVDTYIRWVCGGDNDTSGSLHFHVIWRPITDNGFLEPV